MLVVTSTLDTKQPHYTISERNETSYIGGISNKSFILNKVKEIEQKVQSKMVFVKDWEDFEIAVESMYMENPKTCRYTMKYQHSKGLLILKVTDNVKV